MKIRTNIHGKLSVILQGCTNLVKKITVEFFREKMKIKVEHKSDAAAFDSPRRTLIQGMC